MLRIPTRCGERGSTFILVLAMLSILALLAAALSYTSRLESVASSNFSQAVQAEADAAALMPVALAAVAPHTSLATPLQPWNQLAQLHASSLGTSASRILAARLKTATAAERAKAISEAKRSQQEAGGSVAMTIVDACSRVNVNVISDDRALQKFLQAVFAGTERKAASSAAQARSRGMFKFRRTDAGTTESLQPDLRKAVPAGARRFESLNDLRQAPRFAPELFTAAELEVLQPFVTVFSQSPEVFNAADGTTVAKVALDNLTTDTVIHALETAFPDKERRLLLQYAANLLDYADADSEPVTIEDPDNREAWNDIIGVEQTPLITEIYPDSVTDSATDDGEFIEIHNPWNVAVNLDGWRIAVGSTGGQNVGIALNGVLAPGGYLLITDNYDTRPDNAPPQTGSFLAVFGENKDEAGQRVIEHDSLDLPDQNSFVTLVTPAGNKADVFSYTSMAGANTKRSYQRDDPRVRVFGVADATPFERAPAGVYSGTPAKEQAMKTSWREGNGGTVTLAALMRISTGYAGMQGAGGSVTVLPHVWQTSEFGKGESASGQTDNLDVRVLDLFSTVASLQPEEAKVKDEKNRKEGRSASAGARRSGKSANQKASSLAAAGDCETTSPVLYAYGRININTAPKQVLHAIDAVVNKRDYLPAEAIEKIDKQRLARLAAQQTPFCNPSDLLPLLFEDPDDEQMEAAAKILGQITVGSSAFEVTTQNQSDIARKSKSGPIARLQYLLALDEFPATLIRFGIKP